MIVDTFNSQSGKKPWMNYRLKVRGVPEPVARKGTVKDRAAYEAIKEAQWDIAVHQWGVAVQQWRRSSQNRTAKDRDGRSCRTLFDHATEFAGHEIRDHVESDEVAVRCHGCRDQGCHDGEQQERYRPNHSLDREPRIRFRKN